MEFEETLERAKRAAEREGGDFVYEYTLDGGTVCGNYIDSEGRTHYVMQFPKSRGPMLGISFNTPST